MTTNSKLQVTGSFSPSPAAQQFPLRRTSKALLRLTGTVATVGRFLLDVLAFGLLAIFGGVEITVIDREGARLCECAEAIHAAGEACAMEGSAV